MKASVSSSATKVAAFALGLVAVFGTAYGAGRLTDPVTAAADDRGPGMDGHDGAAGTAGDGPGTGHDGAGAGTAHPASGLLVSDRGYTLSPVTAPAGEFAFQIIGPDGRPVTSYQVAHDKPMHLVVVRRDLSGFRHVHPRLAGDGTWRVDVPFGEPGSWRAFADFTPAGAEPLTLGVDVAVPGDFTPHPLPAPATNTTVDGYTVSLRGGLTAGRDSAVTLTVSRDGQPVTDLQPYLGAYGHLVALRAGDLAYLHVHPDGTPGDGMTAAGPAIGFTAEVPSTGSYRLFLDFRHAGAVHTAAFTVTAHRP